MNKSLKYVITAFIGLSISFAFCLIDRIFTKTSLVDIFHILTNAFFVPGVLLACFGLLVISTNGGTFDMLAYGAIMFFSLFTRGVKRKYKTFYDYRLSKADRKIEFAYLLVVGVIMIGISLIMLALWFKFKNGDTTTS
ncbi:MAG: DUF3899 domain-containing protein [Bacillales bacterium]|nr:DUF3899 domain-containing protein [Bacillales bacterium]